MNQKLAIKIMLWLLGALIVFHFGIILKIIPYEFTWGGRLKNDSEMYFFESVSILINLFLVFILLIKGRHIKQIIPEKGVNIILWVFIFLFGLNTIGNILAKTNFEKFFVLLTSAFTILLWIILKKDQKRTENKYLG
jgi:DNA integrity scanning protein DisA with diadenylate cyclase activity